ncbi:protein kintoun isoform X1 [Spodoptera litura]|uniref:Protein kintoun n=1 Tax=Spodoptera litura TaxID=69820 RepID=A0A9J7E0E5_SPOLT|nr:protein kintoun isoform X1 [Spodoptera litura]
MATGVAPREEESRLTREDLETIQDAMKTKKFRDLLADYCEEIRDPANIELYQKEMTQLEKERGYDVTFLNPKGGYVIKTSVAGDRKAFINICSNENVGKPTYKVEVVNGKRGMNWQIPYSLIPPREDFDHKRQHCVIYDVIFHPDTLRMAGVNKEFRELVNRTALDGLMKTYNIHLDSNNFRFPKSQYKGVCTAAVIRKEDPNYQPLTEEETESLTPEMIEKLYPQRNYSENKQEPELPKEAPKPVRKTRKNNDFSHVSENGYTVPKYVIKQQKNVDLQDFTYNKDCKQYSAIPSQIVVEVYLPLLSSTKDCTLDVQEKQLCLISEKPAKYKLNITLPYSVNDECGTAKFDIRKHLLIVTLPVIKRNININNDNSLKVVDSGVESEENSGSQSDEDNCSNSNLIVELSSSSADNVVPSEPCTVNTSTPEVFLDPSLAYILPPYTHNVLDDIVALTFHVKNTEPDSVNVKNNGNEICIKFTSVGAGFVPVHYAAIINFEEEVKFENVTGEAWDNNVILQLELSGAVPQKFNIGLDKNSMTCESFDVTQKTAKVDKKPVGSEAEVVSPVVEVTNLGTETNIVVSSNHLEYDEDDDFESPTSEYRDSVFMESGSCESGAKSILRKPNMMRSFSESSVGDVASSMDYISSDCIPEESSLKKTVRFNDVIARQFYRYNSSIEGQKKKNQRKKSKKRSQDRRKSESEAEDEISNSSQPRLKSVLKPRRDSGLADTSDAESECKNTPDDGVFNSANDDGFSENNNGEASFDNNKSVFNIVGNIENGTDKIQADIWESEPSKRSSGKRETLTCDNIQHNTNLYDPEKLNKGKYLEVMFKNDLIFDLDM